MKTNEELTAALEYIVKSIDEMKADTKEIVAQTRKTNGRVSVHDVEIAKINTQIRIVAPVVVTVLTIGISMAMNYLFS